MLIRYLLVGDPGERSGVWSKIVAQTAAWAAAGHQVEIAVPRLGDVERSLPDGVTLLSSPPESRGPFGLRELARTIDHPADLLYARYTPYTLGWDRLLRSQPSVIELQTDPVGQYRATSRRNLVRHRLLNWLTFSRADGAVLLSDELIRCLPVRRRGLPMAVVGDAVDLAAIEQLPPHSEGPPTLLYLGKDGPWHGVGQLIELGRRRPDWTIHLVGLDEPHPATTANVHVHGWLDRGQVAALAARCDVAIGPLELHRIGIRRMSPLKTREYLGMGLPVVIGYEDTDFPMGSEWLHVLPPTEGNLLADVVGVEAFIAATRGRRVPRKDIAHLDSAIKESARLDLFDRVVRGGTR